MILHVFRFLSSPKRNLLQTFSATATPGKPPVAPENVTRFFFVVVEVGAEESNIRLMESVDRLAQTLQLPAGRQIRTSYEVSAAIARVVINM